MPHGAPWALNFSRALRRKLPFLYLGFPTLDPSRHSFGPENDKKPGPPIRVMRLSVAPALKAPALMDAEINVVFTLPGAAAELDAFRFLVPGDVL